MKKFFALFLAAAMAFAPACAYAQDAIGTLTYTEGRVERTREGSFYYVPVVKEEPVHSGDVLRTKSASMAEVRFSDGSTVRLGENTQLRIPQYALDPDGKRSKAQLFVDRGVVRAIVEKAKDKSANFLIDTPNMRGAIKGSDIVVGFQRSMTSLASFEGQIQAQSVDFPDEIVTVTPGNTSAITSTAPPAAPRKFLEVEKRRFENETAPRAGDITQEDLSKAVITKYTGDVRVKAKGARDWHRAGLKETLGEGDQIETGENGTVRVLLESGRTVDLKSGTHLGIKQLKVDPETGMRQDVLESLRGQLRANIDKKKGGETSFRVVTPTAVASVRGTILYLNVAGRNVTSYFEQGHGSLLSLIDNTEKVVNAGQYSALQDGVLLDPAVPDQDQINAFRSGWDDYGYSQGEGNTFVPTNFQGTGNDGDEPSLGAAQTLFDQVQNVPDTETAPGVQPIEWAQWNDENGDFDSIYANGGGEPVKVGEETGTVFGLAPWDSAQAFVVTDGTFEGEFQESEGPAPALLWNTGLQSRVEPETENEIETTDAAPDGGALFGRTAGLWNGDELLGNLVAIFVSPTGSAGILQGAVAGLVDVEAGTWSAFGVTVPETLSQMPELDTFDFLDYVEWGWLSGSVVGEFVGEESEASGHLFGDVFGSATNFLWDQANTDHSETWGIYNFWLGGCEALFCNFDELANFGAVIGGDGVFGRFSTGEGENYQEHPDDGYWYGIAGSAEDGWENGEIRGFVEGVYLTRTQMGVIGGNLWGLYDGEGPYGTWLGASAGVFEGLPLAFFSDVEYVSLEGVEMYYYDEDYGYPETFWDGSFSGYFGGAGSLFGDDPAFARFIGDFGIGEGEYYTDHHVWSTGIESYNLYEDNYTTYDGGAYRGYFAGSHHGDALSGRFASVYIAPAVEGEEGPVHAAGILIGDFAGDRSEELGMFRMSGEISRIEKTADVGISAEELENSVLQTGGRGLIEGDFDGNGWLYGEDYLQTLSIANEEYGVASGWGVFIQEFIGEYDNGDGAYTEWSAVNGGYDPFGGYFDEGEIETDYGYWIQFQDGEWSDGEITGDSEGFFLTENRMGSLEGRIFGAANEDGSWVAVNVGTFQGEDLSMNGYWGGEYEEEWDSLYSLDGDELEYYPDGEEWGLIGAVTSPWNAENGVSEFLAMGKYWLETCEDPLVWYTSFSSWSSDRESYVTFDGGAFDGITQGLWSDGEMNGSVAALFYDGNGRAGVIRGKATGGFFEDLSYDEDGLWYVKGDLEAVQSKEVDGLDSEYFSQFIDTREIEDFDVRGRFVSGQEDDNYFAGEPETGFEEEENYAYTSFLNPWNGDNDLEPAHGDRTPTFGIWEARLEGDEFARPDDQTGWTGVLGGEAIFGTYFTQDGEWVCENDDYGYFFARGTGSWSGDNGGLEGSFDGSYLSLTQYGDFEGDLFGLSDVYDAQEGFVQGEWAAAALGSFTGQPLAFAGLVVGGIFEFDFEDFFYGEGEPREFGYLEGLVGGFGDLWNSATQAVPAHFLGYFEGENDGAQLFVNVFTSYDVFRDIAGTFDDGVFVGFVAGRWAGSETAGHARAFYVDPDGNLGFLSGSLTGDNAELDDQGESTSGLWRLDGEFAATPMGRIDGEFEGLEDVYDVDSFFEEFESSIGFAVFEDAEESLLAMASLFLDTGDQESDEDWGLWFGFLAGELSDFEDGDFRYPMAGIVLDEDFFEGDESDADTVFLGTLRGEAATVEEADGDAGTFDAVFTGVWISEDSEDDFLTAGTMTGDFAGQFEREDGTAFVEAAGAGEYQRLTQLDPDKVGYTMEQLYTFFDNMPVSETYAGLLTAVSGGIQGTMDASFFANGATDLGGIWTAIFNGTFDAAPGSAWTFSDAANGINATLNLTQWADNQWLADVTGTLSGVPEGFSGQAGGTFTNPLDDAAGTFTGVGTGVWGTGPALPQPE